MSCSRIFGLIVG